jgi:hypothetical protein
VSMPSGEVDVDTPDDLARLGAHDPVAEHR